MILKKRQVFDAINRLLVKRWPGRIVYVNQMPNNFQRPSFCLQAVTSSMRNHGRKVVEITDYYTIICYIQKDKRGNCDHTDLLDLQDDVLSLFRRGYLLAADRAVTVSASTGGMEEDTAYVDITVHYYDDRDDEEEEAPRMEEVVIQQKGE